MSCAIVHGRHSAIANRGRGTALTVTTVHNIYEKLTSRRLWRFSSALPSII
jgi:hypothetical protein